MADDPQLLIDQQYTGGKAALRPIYDRLAEAIKGFGDDVELSPMKAYVSVKRGKQFALLQPSTATRFDVGIKLKGVAPHGRLEDSASFTTMVTHRVKVARLEDVDAELIDWLKQAYDSAG
jgi:predicted transport protein